MTTAAPPQHLQALEWANEVRIERAALKRQIADGSVSVAEALSRRHDPRLARMQLGELLRAQVRWRSVRCRKFLSRLAMSEGRPIGKLTDRQVSLLTAELR